MLFFVCSNECNIPIIQSIFLILLGTALKCHECTPPECNVTTVECPKGQCYTVSTTGSNDKSAVVKGCDEANTYCRDVKTACQRLEQDAGEKFKSCDGSCCSTDFCNTAKEIMVAKAFICLMAIVGYLLA